MAAQRMKICITLHRLRHLAKEERSWDPDVREFHVRESHVRLFRSGFGWLCINLQWRPGRRWHVLAGQTRKPGPAQAHSGSVPERFR